MATEQQIYIENRAAYDMNAVCPSLEPNFTTIFRKLRDSEAFVDESGQVIWKTGNMILAAFYRVPLIWSLEARMIGVNDSAPFETTVLVKNPGRVNNEHYTDAGVGAVNGLVMIGDTLWCTAIQPGQNTMKIMRRVTDLNGFGRDFQQELSASFKKLIENTNLSIESWNPRSNGRHHNSVA